MRTPDFVLRQSFKYYGDGNQSKELPQGAFVRPLEFRYVPLHVKEQRCNRNFDENTEVYCYTRIGIIALPKDNILEVR